MIIGYARVSSVDQNLDVQMDKLKGCEKVFTEKQSGRLSERPQLKKCLAFIREGDTLVVTRLDRLARSTRHLCNIAADLEKRGVALKVIDQSIDTSNATGRLLFHVLASIAQFENELRAERQMDGIRKAKEKGVKFGRRRRLTRVEVEELHRLRKMGALIKELCAKYGISKSSVYRYLEEAVNGREGEVQA